MKAYSYRVNSVIRMLVSPVLLILVFLLKDRTRWIGLNGLLPFVAGLAQHFIANISFNIETHKQKLVSDIG